MATRLPDLKIPVTVQTDGVDRGLSAVERKLRNTAAKMKRLGGGVAGGGGGAGGGLGGALGAPKGTAFLGGLGKLGPLSGLLGGLGAGGLAIAAPLAAINAAMASVQQFASMTAGAGEALDKFRQTGEQTFAANAGILELLAQNEKSAQQMAKTMSFTEAATLAANRPGEVGMGQYFSELTAKAGARFGAFVSGKSNAEISLLQELQTASEPRSKEILDELRKAESTRYDKSLVDGLASESIMWSVEKMAQNFFRWWDG